MTTTADTSPISLDGDLQTLGVEHFSQCVNVMAQAFCDSPAYKYIFQGTPTYRTKALEWLFNSNLKLILSKDPTCLQGIVNGNGEVICCFLWVPSEAAQLSTGEMIWGGMWQIPFRFGMATLNRLVTLLDAMEGAKGKVTNNNDGNVDADKTGNNDNDDGQPPPKMEYIMLQRMVVLPQYQGKGVGSHALKAMLSKSAAASPDGKQKSPSIWIHKKNVMFDSMKNLDGRS